MEDVLSADTILAEIESESLQDFLAAVKRDSSPAGSSCIPALDTYLSSVNTRRTSHNWPLNRGDVIELQGPAASGKTHLVYHLLVTCLMPCLYHGKKLQGWGKTAVLFDTDANFSISRLRELLVSRLTRLLGSETVQEIPLAVEDLATQCLENLHVFRPTSTPQLAITLLHLPRFHATNPRTQDMEIGLVAIDSLSAFYWRDRYTLEQLRDASETSSHAALSPNPLLYVLRALQHIRTSHRSVIVMTNWGLNPLTKPSTVGEQSPLFYKQHLHPFPAPFEPHGTSEAIANIAHSQQLSTSADTTTDNVAGRAPRQSDAALPLHYHITLHPSPIDPFPQSYSLSDAVNQEHMRAVLVNKGEIKGLIRVPGESDVGEFTFNIGEREIVVDLDGQL